MRNEAVPLDDPCADGQVKTVMKSRGYRKEAGDVCIKGAAGLDFEPYEFTCCVTINDDSKMKAMVVGIGAALGGALLLVLIIMIACLAW